eukprot:scaffold14829_cov115-Isochrysis_galbana.AAC.2
MSTSPTQRVKVFNIVAQLSQPIWDNRHHPPPKIPPLFRDKWESLQVTVVHNTFSDRVGARHYTKEENQPHTDARSPRTARSKNWMIFRKYPTYRLPSAYRWYSVPTKRPEAKQAHAPEIFAIPAEDLREDKKSSQYLPSWDFRLFPPPSTQIRVFFRLFFFAVQHDVLVVGCVLSAWPCQDQRHLKMRKTGANHSPLAAPHTGMLRKSNTPAVALGATNPG